jgi:hypothetical protein
MAPASGGPPVHILFPDEWHHIERGPAAISPSILDQEKMVPHHQQQDCLFPLGM